MNKDVIGYCPVCNEKLIATKLTCRNCKLDITGDFALNRFSYLTKEELEFILLFLDKEGSFKEVQTEMNVPYQKVKKMLGDILVKLSLKTPSKTIRTDTEKMDLTDNVIIMDNDHFIVQRIKEKLNSCSGRAIIPLISGKQAEIWYRDDGNGLECDKIPVPNQLTWPVFIETYNLATAQEGELIKGNARAGKLGSEKLPLDSLEGFVAYKVHGVREGESAFGPGFIIAAILDWAGIFKNERGKIVLNTEFAFVKTYDEALENARTYFKGMKESNIIQERLATYRHWYYFDELDAFAPSKFIGYKDMDFKTYARFYNNGLNGMDTEKALQKIFDTASEDIQSKLKYKLENQIQTFGKQLNRNFCIHVKK